MLYDENNIPDGYKYYIYTVSEGEDISNGGFIGEDIQAIFDVEPIKSFKNITMLVVVEVDKETFNAHLEKGTTKPDFKVYDKGYYNNQ